MRWLKSTVQAFSIFSRIPVPTFDWDKENLRYTAGFFPLVGAVIALFLWGWYWLCQYLSFGSLLFAAGLVIIPVTVTGGIHHDGFCDTIDAMSSHGDKEKRKKILADPHIGAFAVISLILYFLAYFALGTEIKQAETQILALGIIHFLSRIFVGLGIIYFPAIHHEGLFNFIKMSTSKKGSTVLLSIFFIAANILLYLLLGWYFVFIIIVAVLYTIFIYFKFKLKFGGMNGDLAGFWLQTMEIILLAVLIIIDKVTI